MARLLRLNEEANLADAVERQALSEEDRTATSSNLDSALRRHDAYKEWTSEERSDLVNRTFRSLRKRALVLGSSYPFVIQGDQITLKDPDVGSTYRFLLALHHTTEEEPSNDAWNRPTVWFEELCVIVASAYVSGSGLRFGWPRQSSRSFLEELADVLKAIGEGEVKPNAPLLSKAKDGGLDVVAWRSFNDNRPGNTIMFGQCATGKNWRDKVTELQPYAFLSTFLNDHPISLPIRAFFLPHVIADDELWMADSRRAGIVFDRIRICLLTPELPHDLQKALKWTSRAMKCLVLA